MPRQPASRAPSSAEPAAETPAAVLARLERDFALTLDSSAEVSFSGEHLAALSARIRSHDIESMTVAFAYARRWAQQDPQGMFDWLQKQGRFAPSMGERHGAYTLTTTLFQKWAQRDPSQALAAAKTIRGPAFDLPFALVTIIEVLRKSDPARAAAEAAENLPLLASQRTGSFNAHDADYTETWHSLRSLPPGRDRGTLLARFLDEVARRRETESARLWRELPEDMQREMLASGGTGIRKSDSLGQIEEIQRAYVEQTGNPRTAEAFLRVGAREWVQRDPAAAIAWAQQHLKGKQRVDGTAPLFSAGAAENFDATLQVWQSLPDGILRARAAGHLAGWAPASRKAEMDALMDSLSPADRNIALSIRRGAEGTRAQQEADEQRRRAR